MTGHSDLNPTAGRPDLPSVVWIPGGPFTMGQEPLFEAEAPSPPHVVTLSPFWIGLHPVTRAEYRTFAELTGMPLPEMGEADDADRPVVNVHFQEALAYCRWAGGILPTEAQWELAARGTDGRRFPWGDSPPDEERACFGEDWNRGGPARIATHPKGASPFGCQDMAGNVWEWCLDVFQMEAHAERARVRHDPCGVGTARIRPLRGGCWRSIECKLQAAYRNWSHEVARHTTIGFRLCFAGQRR